MGSPGDTPPGFILHAALSTETGRIPCQSRPGFLPDWSKGKPPGDQDYIEVKTGESFDLVRRAKR